MKNIRYIYVFRFYGKGLDTVVEIKAETLRDLYYKILDHEPALDTLSDYAWNCTLTRTHIRRTIPTWHCKKYSSGFLPCQVMYEKDYNRLLNRK